MIARHSTIAHAAYHDLLTSPREEAVAEILGTPTRLERGGRAYWYDTYRIGSDVRKACIGKDSDALRADCGVRRADARSSFSDGGIFLDQFNSPTEQALPVATSDLPQRSPAPLPRGRMVRKGAP